MTQSNESKFFDLHTTGIGYLNRIREVTVRKGPAFLACTVAALHGSADDVEYSYIDCKVAGAEAQKLVRRCKEAVDAGKKVLVSFKIGDIWTDPFIYQNGDKKGQPGAQLKGRLLFIGRISVDGDEVYRAPERNASSDEAEQSDGNGETASPLSSVA
ncbi:MULTISPECIES: STY4534 family ICE replication protein [Stutzerimonas]|jgi:hypothetical protein|uniref:STY4534 family ICE replication protein n=1 Tax=Stutzerimonas TaxID=2901164 RepID=UPI001F3E6EE8|nr:MULTISPECIES: STY4534 family ICE replication protein [Stutzerimonas]MCQ2036616.1 STY4534 family ICE replication protein [Stutzerimonas kunmingensis]|tara:strand:- start:26881 stop:27351 length:471 start_codon:yes stop_codon:yes gene_type:complete